MRRIFRGLFFVASFMMCCLLFNIDKVFAATTTTCVNDGGKCNICYTSYVNGKPACAHVKGKEYENIVYYFHCGDQCKYWELDKKYLIKSGEVKKENIVPIYVGSKSKFVEEWNLMGVHNGKEYYVRAVVINMHGKKDENVIGDKVGLNDPKKEKEIRITQSDIKNLTEKYVERLILLTCHGADGYKTNKTNIAKLFSERIKSGEVIAGSAQVYGYPLITWKNREEYYVYYVAMEVALDENEVFTPSNTYNDSYNWILYRDEKVIKVCSGDCYSINGLLVMGKTYEEEE